MSESSMPPMRADWVGRRVVVRHSGESAEPPYHDIVGELVEVTATHAVVRRADGERRRVPLDRIVAAKVVAAATRDILAIEQVCTRGWRAIDTTWSRGWLLRANHGFTRRANSALPLRPIQGSLDEVVAAAYDWYGARGLPLRVSCPLPARQALDDALANRGFPALVDVDVLVAALSTVPSSTEPVEIAPVPSADWLVGYHYRGAAEVPDHARAILTRHDRVGFATVRCAGAVAGVARGAVDGDWLGVTAVEVDPPVRRTGVATSLLGALRDWAMREHGASRSYVQVETTNDAAIRLYAGLGYWHHHVYRYRIDPRSNGTPS
jgi:GNAT superfamily N-acetyltransferase